DLLRQNSQQPDEPSETRLEHLVMMIEEAVHGEEMLVPEDLLEFATYLSINDRHLRKKAIDLFKQRLKPSDVVLMSGQRDRGQIRSKLGEMHRPISGDLIVDVICDVLSAMGDEEEQDTYNIIQLLGITGQ
ncbi:hypothetical protein RFI_17343, partial [Reticulomyxa filosa]